MIRIFNKSNGYEILIDESVEWVRLMPRHYEDEDPHMWIEMSGYDWGRHAESCAECGAFLADFGKPRHSWWLQWQGKSWPLILVGFGNAPGKNRLLQEFSEYFEGTRLKLKLDTRSIDDLHGELTELIRLEDYEGCVVVRDLIHARSRV